MAEREKLIELKDVKKVYGKGEAKVAALKDINLSYSKTRKH